MHWANGEQQNHMRELARIPPEQLCWCGWCRIGRCDTPSACNINHAGKSAADKLRARDTSAVTREPRP
jgi:hypothetical protein